MTNEMIGTATFLPGLVLSLVIGFLIGLERGWRARDEPQGSRVAGVRTFAIIGLLGGVAGAMMHLWLSVIVIGAVLATLSIGYVVDAQKDGNVSATSVIAGQTTLLLGVVAGSGAFELASVGAATLLTILALRKQLHALVQQASEADLMAVVRLVLVVLLILPLLPDTSLGPFGGINPRRIWFVVVVIGSISLGGYVLTRWIGGRKGVLLISLAGATVSSTAVTLECARRIRSGTSIAADQAAISIASTVMLARTLILVAGIAPLALADVIGLVGPALVASLAAGLVATFLTRRDEQTTPRPITVSPPGLSLAIGFAALVVIISFAAGWMRELLGQEGGAAVIAIGGMVDVDSAIAAIGALPEDSLSVRLSALAIAAPIMFNTILKLALLVVIAGIWKTKWAAANLGMTALLLFAMIVSTWI